MQIEAKRPRRLRTLLILLGTLAVIFLVVVACLPAILSTGAVRSMVLRRVNESAPGTLSISDWSITWLNGIRFFDLGYIDDPETLEVAVDEIRVEHGLLALARNYQHFGTVDIARPIVRVRTTPAPADTEPGAIAPSPSAGPGSGEPRPETGAAIPIVVPDLFGRILIRDGAVQVTRPDGAKETVLVDLSVDLDLEGLANPIRYRVTGRSPASGGTMESGGTVTLMRDGTFSPEQVGLETTLRIQGLDLNPWTTMATAWAEVPVASGRLNASLSVAGSVADGVHVIGNVFVPDLRLSGGPLGSDTPALGQTVLNVDAVYVDHSLQISNLTVRSSIANASARGRVVDASSASVSASAELNLGGLFTQFPETLSLREGLVVSGGTLNFTSEVTRVDESVRFDVRSSIHALRGQLDGKPVSWDAPMALRANGEWAPGAWRLDELQLRSPFLTADGQGTQSRARVILKADLSAAQQELGKFIRLDEWQAGGSATVEVTVNEVGEGARVLQSRLEVDGAMLARNGTVWVPTGPLRIDASGRLELNDVSPAPVVIMRPSLTWDTWLGSGKVLGDSIAWSRSDDEAAALPEINGLAGSGDIELSALTRLLHAADLLPADQGFRGTVAFELEGETRPDQLAIRKAQVALSGFSVSMPQGTISDDFRVVLSDAVRGGGRVSASAATLESTAGTMRLRDLRLATGPDARLALNADGDAALDLGRLTAMLSDVVSLPQGTAVSGSGRGTFHVELASGNSSEIRLQSEVEALRITSEGRPAIEEDRVTLSAHVTGGGPGDTVHVRALELESAPLTLNASGTWDSAGERNHANAEGEFALDLELLAAYVQSMAGLDIQMRGKDRESFTFASEWEPGTPNGMIRGASFETKLHADAIEAFGLDVRDLSVPFRLRDGIARADLAANVNRGTVRVTPVIDLNSEPRLLTLENPTNLLTNVELTSEMSDGLLGRIHPLFRGASVVGGTVSMGMDQFAWPLDPAYRNQALFAGSLELRDLRMEAEGLIGRLLAAMKVRDREMDIGDRTITFVCKNERIECSPTKIEIEGHLLTISGTMGLDQTLDYIAQIPVTQDMVGREAYGYLEGTTIRVPIRGTASDPDLSLRVVQDAAADLARQALQKALREKGTKLLEGLLQ